ncbi:hypothetical protein ACFLR5_00475 [Elusimicrobiota bacterium]
MKKTKVFKAWTFFRRGHSVYLVFAMSFLNFLVIQWRLLISKNDFLSGLFGHFIIFAVIFILVYIPFAVIIGWKDYRYGSVPVDLKESAKANPFNKDIAIALSAIADNDRDAARSVLMKWTK